MQKIVVKNNAPKLLNFEDLKTKLKSLHLNNKLQISCQIVVRFNYFSIFLFDL